MSSFEFLAALLLLAAILFLLMGFALLSVKIDGSLLLAAAWGIALALTLEPSPYRGTLLAVCYAVVVFTILVQGLSMPLLIRRLYRPSGV